MLLPLLLLFVSARPAPTAPAPPQAQDDAAGSTEPSGLAEGRAALQAGDAARAIELLEPVTAEAPEDGRA